MFLESEKRLIHVLKAVALLGIKMPGQQAVRELSSCWMDTLTDLTSIYLDSVYFLILKSIPNIQKSLHLIFCRCVFI